MNPSKQSPDSVLAPPQRVIPIARAGQRSLIEAVVAGGFCIGCGACTAIDGRITIVSNQYGDLVAQIPPAAAGDPLQASRVCPFASARDESALGASVFPQASVDSPMAGRYLAAYKGYSVPYRRYGSSGGIGTHVLATLLEQQQIDTVLCVGPSAASLAEYQAVSGVAELLQCSTSFYFPITLAQVLQTVRARPGRYAVTGVPCFHKAIRLLKEHDPVLRERIVLQVGLVCGQMKSAHYADYMARRSGMPASAELKQINFRRKEGTPRADDYNFVAQWQLPDGSSGQGQLAASAIGFNWGMSYFKPKACDFCDDVYAECADLVIMDAWLPGDVEDARGTSIVLARSAPMAALLAQESANGRLALQPASHEQVIVSQEGGLRHRRQGLRFRLAVAGLGGRWRPRKRVRGTLAVGLMVALEMLFRMTLRQRSRQAYLRQRAAGDGLALFERAMHGPKLAYRVFSKGRRLIERYLPARAGRAPLQTDPDGAGR